ncbi:MAG: hypothetical protein AVDCRST_MAG66-3321 [uncultured Pseudonocardia sp.]|uniref:Uncharacterized protein n=1 Tax=uncultured Pseudonocardia sp. TaxID=211455 RepID=A0A6J4Q0X2_9PSEU|nr:MAG: hypothetical protein AVDCRST_MAG66-3321 [uncultured Pseudonocardia sp.]
MSSAVATVDSTTAGSAIAEAAARTDLQQSLLVHLAAALDTLSVDELRALAEGRGRLVFSPEAPAPSEPAAPVIGAQRGVPHRPSARPTARPTAVVVDVSADVAAIHGCATPEQVRAYLAERRFTVPVLRQLARALGPTVPASGRSRAELVHAIVEGTVGFRARSHALSGGAWVRS